MIKVGIIGATGYAGGELVRLLDGHKDTEVIWYGSRSYIGSSYSSVFQNTLTFADDLCRDDNIEELSKAADVIFTATPQGFLAERLSDEILNHTRVIDLSADYRIKDIAVYEKWYRIEHKSPALMKEAVYGLCEKNRAQIKNARLIANPGCYPTCSYLTIYPMIKAGYIDLKTLLIDAKSGTSGAGRGAKVDNLFCEVNENIKAYSVASHRHTPEIEEQLSDAAGQEIRINFTPHLLPMNRGILITAYADIKKGVTQEDIRLAYEAAYQEESFVRLLEKGVCPQTRWVRGSNFVDVNAVLDPRTGRVIMMGAMDNLVKGAAGQAVQNMNLMFDLPEHTGLHFVPLFP